MNFLRNVKQDFANQQIFFISALKKFYTTQMKKCYCTNEFISLQQSQRITIKTALEIISFSLVSVFY